MKTLIYSTLEKAVNRYLQMDPTVIEKLAGVSGKVVLFDVNKLGKFYCLLGSEAIQIKADYDNEPDAMIQGSLFALFRASRAKSKVEAGQEELDISGDVELGEKVSDIFRHIDIDWEEQSAKIMGDVAAHKLGNVVRSAKSWLNKGAASIRQNITEYIQEETGQLPSRAEVDDFIKEVDELRHAVERLSARIDLMVNKQR